MQKSKFSDSQTLSILKQYESGIPVTELARGQGGKHCTALSVTYEIWRDDAALMKRLKELETKNAHLKKM